MNHRYFKNDYYAYEHIKSNSIYAIISRDSENVAETFDIRKEL